MSIFNELLPKLLDISNITCKNFNDELQGALDELDKFEKDYQKGRGTSRDKLIIKDKTLTTTLQSINEDDDEPRKNSDPTKTTNKSSDKENTTEKNTTEKDTTEKKTTEKATRRTSKKRSKDEVDGMLSPETDKRQKRNASVKAQSNISKQVNVSLAQKLRREEPTDKKSRRRKEDEKENSRPILPVQVKQEKVSIPPEPMDMESLPVDVEVKREPNKDEIAMPPPSAVPKPRRAAQKDKDRDTAESSDDESGKRRNTRNKKQNETIAAPIVASSRSTRASSRASRRTTKILDDMPPPPEPRPKRTRAKKKVSEPSTDSDKTPTQAVEESLPASPPEKQRPKRTRKGKNDENPTEPQKPVPPPKDLEPKLQPVTKQEKISLPNSPVLKVVKNKLTNKQNTIDSIQTIDDTNVTEKQDLNTTVTICNDMDKTVVLPNGVYNHAPVTPKAMRSNETIVLENRETMVLEPAVNDATVVLEARTNNHDSLLTDDDSETCTPERPIPEKEPTSAVKVKVQQFEELASRTTRTKTRAMKQTAEHTPPDKIVKPGLNQDTLEHMNNMIFNGKTHQLSSSAIKPRPLPSKPLQSASTSKLSSLHRHKQDAEDSLKREKEDARKKKEAMLEAKRELQKKKREEKMANAAAAREAAERERKLAMEAAASSRREKQQHADIGKMERLKEAERKKQELARKVAETEERRKAEEVARQQRLADEQRKAELQRRRQQEEAEAMKEAALMAKEIEKKQREYMEKQKMRQNERSTPLKPGAPGYVALEPVYMCDGFQYLNSDEEDDSVQRVLPAWSSSKARNLALVYQSSVPDSLIDALFSVRRHTPDLRAIFPNIERARLKRTSSAVWRTPPRLPPVSE